MTDNNNWSIAKELCGENDLWEFKYYILIMLFYRYLSEDITTFINAGEIEAGTPDFDYTKLSDEEAETARDDMRQTKGFFILPSQLFCNVLVKAETDENLNETLEQIFNSIESSSSGYLSEKSLSGLFAKFDANSHDLGDTVSSRNARLAKLMNGVAQMQIDSNSNTGYGAAYEELMGRFASEAGKKGGDSFTPAHISRLLIKLALAEKKDIRRIYDPACGSGSLLLKSIQELSKTHVHGIFGQDINPTSFNLCRMNMFMNVDYDRFDIACGDTLIDPQHWDDEPFDVIVSNPKFDIKWEGKDNPLLINDPRYAPAGVLPPPKSPYWAFVLHSLAWLGTNGTAVLVCEPGALYRSNNKAEPHIRQYLIDNNYVDCVIQLASNLFFKDKGSSQTSIAVCVIILKKNKNLNSTLFIDATKECTKVASGNTLTEENIAKIVSSYINREEQPGYCKLVPNSEIANNQYNLSVRGYTSTIEKREEIDITQLNAETDSIINRVNQLNKEIDAVITEIESSIGRDTV